MLAVVTIQQKIKVISQMGSMFVFYITEKWFEVSSVFFRVTLIPATIPVQSITRYFSTKKCNDELFIYGAKEE
jgi:hypothetical protein